MAKKKVVSKTRRANNEGSIYQRKNGTWAGMATVGYDKDGKIIRKTVYGKTRMDVAKKLTDITNRIANANLDYVENNTFGQMMNEWMLIFKKQLVSPRTFEHQYRNFKLHIMPQIGNMKIDEVTTIVVQKLLNEMLEKDYSLDSTRKVKFLINQFFEYAIENKLATDNPAIKTKVKSAERRIYDSENKYKAIPPQKREEFIKALDDHDFLKPFCFVMMFAGLRVGEALALTWQNVDLENKILKVEHGVTIVPKFDEHGKVKERLTVVGDTKTACSVREVPMPDILVGAIKEYKQRQRIKSKESGKDLLTANMFVFCNDDGKVRTYSGTKTIFDRFLKSHKLNNIGIHFHGLRHTYSNTLFENNQNPKVIQALLGHKSVKTTITTYNSVDKSYFQKATDVFNEKYGGNKENQNRDGHAFVESLDDEQLDRLANLIEERKRKKEKDFEM